jgi:hypothetical protein
MTKLNFDSTAALEGQNLGDLTEEERDELRRIEHADDDEIRLYDYRSVVADSPEMMALRQNRTRRAAAYHAAGMIVAEVLTTRELEKDHYPFTSINLDRMGAPPYWADGAIKDHRFRYARRGDPPQRDVDETDRAYMEADVTALLSGVEATGRLTYLQTDLDHWHDAAQVISAGLILMPTRW